MDKENSTPAPRKTAGQRPLKKLPRPGCAKMTSAATQEPHLEAQTTYMQHHSKTTLLSFLAIFLFFTPTLRRNDLPNLSKTIIPTEASGRQGMPSAFLKDASPPALLADKSREMDEARKKQLAICPTDDDTIAPKAKKPHKQSFDYIWRTGVAGGLAGSAVRPWKLNVSSKC